MRVHIWNRGIQGLNTMAQNSFALMTNLGRAKEAAALANGTSIIITHIAIGDGLTVPSGGETSLYNEIARKQISSHGTVIGASNVAYFDIFLSSSEGPFTIREAGLYDSTGALIAIARYDPPINKPVPSSGQTVEGTVRLQVAFSNIASITIVVDPSFKVPLQRLTRLPWLPIVSMTLASPPVTPTVGDVYIVATGASGAWSGQAGKIAEYTSAGWSIITPPEGHGVTLPSGRMFVRRGGEYSEYLATTDAPGLVELATVEEVNAGVPGLVVTAAALDQRKSTETLHGLVELATNAETQTGTDIYRAVTPAGLASLTASTTRSGLVELATNAETQSGADNVRAVTPAGLASLTASTTRAGLVELATVDEVLAGASGLVVTAGALGARTSTLNRTGIIALASQAEADAGVVDNKAMTPAVQRRLQVPNFRYERNSLSLAENVLTTTFNFDSGGGLYLMPESSFVNNALTIGANEAGLWDFLVAVRINSLASPGFIEVGLYIDGQVYTADTAGKTGDFDAQLSVTYSETRTISPGTIIQPYARHRNTASAARNLYVRFLGKRVAA